MKQFDLFGFISVDAFDVGFFMLIMSAVVLLTFFLFLLLGSAIRTFSFDYLAIARYFAIFYVGFAAIFYASESLTMLTVPALLNFGFYIYGMFKFKRIWWEWNYQNTIVVNRMQILLVLVLLGVVLAGEIIILGDELIVGDSLKGTFSFKVLKPLMLVYSAFFTCNVFLGWYQKKQAGSRAQDLRCAPTPVFK